MQQEARDTRELEISGEAVLARARASGEMEITSNLFRAALDALVAADKIFVRGDNIVILA